MSELDPILTLTPLTTVLPGKIKDLLTKDVVDDSTKLVLVNAIYFKGKWQEQFKEEETVEAPFRVNKVMLRIRAWTDTF